MKRRLPWNTSTPLNVIIRRTPMRHLIIFTHRSWLVLLALAAVALATLACGFEGGAFGSTPTPSSASRAITPAVGNAASQPAAGAVPDMSGAPVEAILITAPQPGQGVRGALRIEGLSDQALAQQLNVVVRDAQGTVIATAQPVVKAQPNQRSTFSVDVALPPDVPRQTGQVQVYAVS